MTDAYIYDAVRSPRGKGRADGSLHELTSVALSAKIPSLIVVLRETQNSPTGMPFEPMIVTASPYEGQDYLDSGDGLIESVPMPLGVIGWVRDFVQDHHVEEVFIKRKRDKQRVDLVEDGKGDARVRQMSDVFRAPRGTTSESGGAV